MSATSCYNCKNNCPGILLDVIKYQELMNPDTIFHMQFLISEKLSYKGYRCVNLCYVNVEGEMQHVLQLDYDQVDKFVENMNQLGYTCKSIPAHKRRYRWVVFKEYTPMELLYVYHYLDVIS